MHLNPIMCGDPYLKAQLYAVEQNDKNRPFSSELTPCKGNKFIKDKRSTHEQEKLTFEPF